MEKNQIYCINIINFIPKIKNNFIDCIITNLPYYTKTNYNNKNLLGSEQTVEEYLNNISKIFIDLKSKMKNDGFIAININDTKNLNIPKKLELILTDHYKLLKTIEWSNGYSNEKLYYFGLDDSNILDIGSNKWEIKEDKINNHPTSYPIELVDKILLDISEINDLIFDPFIGSGTTAISCIKKQRYFIGVDINKDYVISARDRIKKESD